MASRRIPITIGFDQRRVIGFITLDDDGVSDKDVMESSVSWAYHKTTGAILQMTIVPKMQAVER